jgi:hypothetical protein
MISFTLDLTTRSQGTDALGWRSTLGIEISRWCQEHGLVRNQDYAWWYMLSERTLHFKFYGEDESFATLFALRWAEYL